MRPLGPPVKRERERDTPGMKKKGTLLERPRWKEPEGAFQAISIEGERVADGAERHAEGDG